MKGHIFRTADLLQKPDQTEFSMLEKIPDIFSGKPFNNIGGRNPLYNSSLGDEVNEISMNEYVFSIEQIPAPYDLEELQSKTEDEHLSESKKL